MIDKEMFSQQMGILGDRFGRPLAAPTLRAYYEELSGKLSTTDFVAATAIAFAQSKFWPAPAELIAFVKPEEPTALVAADLFAKVSQAVGNSYASRTDRLAKVAALGALAERAFRAVGAFGAFENLEQREVPWLRKRFVEAYEAAATFTTAQEAAALALPVAEERVRALIAGVASARAIPARASSPAPPTTRGQVHG